MEICTKTQVQRLKPINCKKHDSCNYNQRSLAKTLNFNRILLVILQKENTEKRKKKKLVFV